MDEEAGPRGRRARSGHAVATLPDRLLPTSAIALAIAAVSISAAGIISGCRRAAAPARNVDLSVPFRPSDIPRIDTHVHLTARGTARALQLEAAHGITHLVDLSGGPPGGPLENHLAMASLYPGRITVFTTPDFRACLRPKCGEVLAAELVQAKKLGAAGMKIPKALGLGWENAAGQLLAVDDPVLDPLFEKAGALHMPVAIHIGDPKAFWRPPTPDNERIDELSAHPGWSYYGEPVPSWEDLYAAFERLVARHPGTTFIGVHFGNDPEDPDRVAAMLAAHPNLCIDTAARVPEIGRQDAAHDPAKMRAFFLRWQDRILFGTDVGVGSAPDDLMLGSMGRDPPTPAEVERFYDATWRYFETTDRGFLHPTPIQGRWRIDGIGLPRDVLAKVYYQNAARLIGIPLPLPSP